MSKESSHERESQAGVEDRDLLARVAEGDSAAEHALFNRYYMRLVTYARQHMNARLQRIEPPSDVAQSAMKSVLLGIPLAEFKVDEGEELWPLLVTVVLNKIRNRHKKHTRSRRADLADVPMGNYELLMAGKDCSGEVELRDLIEQLLAQFPPRRRRILELLLQGCRGVDIAEELSISERTVYNTRQQAATCLKSLIEG